MTMMMLMMMMMTLMMIDNAEDLLYAMTLLERH